MDPYLAKLVGRKTTPTRATPTPEPTRVRLRLIQGGVTTPRLRENVAARALTAEEMRKANLRALMEEHKPKCNER